MKQQRKPLGKNPTPKQKKAAELLVENSGSDNPKSVGEILEDAGYSKGTAHTPTKVTRAEGFITLMEKMGITDDKLVEVMQDGLSAVSYVKTERVTGIGKTRVKSEKVVAVPDIKIRHKYLETGLRLKGLGRSQGEPNINFYQLAGEVKNEFSTAA